MNNELSRAQNSHYIDHAQAKVPEGSFLNDNNDDKKVKNLMDEWGSEYGKIL